MILVFAFYRTLIVQSEAYPNHIKHQKVNFPGQEEIPVSNFLLSYVLSTREGHRTAKAVEGTTTPSCFLTLTVGN